MKENTSIILHIDNAIAIQCLKDEQAGVLFKAIFNYAKDGKPLETNDTALLAVFSMFKAQIDRDAKKYEQKCLKNRANAFLRYAKSSIQEPAHPNDCDQMQAHADLCLSKSNCTSNSSNNDNDKNNIITCNNKDTSFPFSEIWNMYGKPIGDECFLNEMWNKLSEEEKKTIHSYIPIYVTSTPEVKYRKNFEIFLSQRYWETHPLTQQNYGIKTRNNIANGDRKQKAYTDAAELISELSKSANQ